MFSNIVASLVVMELMTVVWTVVGETKIDFSRPISAMVSTGQGDAEVTAFPVSSETSSEENAPPQPGQRLLASIGQPSLVRFQSAQNASSQTFTFTHEGFYCFVDVLTEGEKFVLANAASEKFAETVKPSQIIRLSLDETRCNAEIFVNGSKLQYAGKVSRNNIYPLRLKFESPVNSLLRGYFEQMVASGSEISLVCTAKKLKRPSQSVVASIINAAPFGAAGEVQMAANDFAYVRQFQLYTNSLSQRDASIAELMSKQADQMREALQRDFARHLEDQVNRTLSLVQDRAAKLMSDARQAADTMLTEAASRASAVDPNIAQEFQAMKRNSPGRCRLCLTARRTGYSGGETCSSENGWEKFGDDISWDGERVLRLLCKKASDATEDE